MRVVVEREQVTMPLDAFERDVHAVINLANRPFSRPFPLAFRYPDFPPALFPLRIYRLMETHNGQD